MAYFKLPSIWTKPKRCWALVIGRVKMNSLCRTQSFSPFEFPEFVLWQSLCQRLPYFYTALVARDGKWSPWSGWSACSKPCGKGKRTRYRFCTSPFPAHGGKDCVGNHALDEDCNTENCPSKCIVFCLVSRKMTIMLLL